MLQWNAEDGISATLAAEKLEDLDFGAVVQAADVLVLVGTHVEAVARLSWAECHNHEVPEEAKLLCAFFRRATHPLVSRLGTHACAPAVPAAARR